MSLPCLSRPFAAAGGLPLLAVKPKTLSWESELSHNLFSVSSFRGPLSGLGLSAVPVGLRASMTVSIVGLFCPLPHTYLPCWLGCMQGGGCCVCRCGLWLFLLYSKSSQYHDCAVSDAALAPNCGRVLAALVGCVSCSEKHGSFCWIRYSIRATEIGLGSEPIQCPA